MLTKKLTFSRNNFSACQYWFWAILATTRLTCQTCIALNTTTAFNDFAIHAANSTEASLCSSRKYETYVNAYEDVEDLELDVPVHIAFKSGQKKRFLLQLEAPSPLTISFSHNVSRKIFYNATTHITRLTKSAYQEPHLLLLPCALRGQYDLFVQARQRDSIKIEALGKHTQAAFLPLLNNTHRIKIRTQYRIGKGQMVVKWHKSKFDVHAVHYCLVISAQKSHTDFCESVQEQLTAMAAARKKPSCYPNTFMEQIWQRPPDRMRKIDARYTNVVCAGSRTRQQLSGLLSQQKFYLDLFGVHTNRQNLTFHLASTVVNFERTQPMTLRSNILNVEKIWGQHGRQVFSFKVPSAPTTRSLDSVTPPNSALSLRYLILPCDGSEVNATFLQKRHSWGSVSVYEPTYVRIPKVNVGERFMVRFKPSNKDEALRANEVGLAVTTRGIFSYLPELPENISVFEVRSDCESSKVAWYTSPDNRTMRYCVIVFNLPQRNRSAVDYTNYCMDFGKRVKRHPQFHAVDCIEKVKSSPTLEEHMIRNLSPGKSYLIYVTANLQVGRALPYRSLRVRTNNDCSYDSNEQSAYY